MKLYTRLFLSHLLVICVALGAVLLISEALASAFIRHHVEQMVTLIGPDGASLRPDLERGVRRTLNAALLASLPLALVVAALTALLSARRVVRSVTLLRDGSHAIATGDYARRLPEEGRDELTDVARHFNRMAASLQQVEQGRVELISNVAHELRTPLSALRGYAEAMKDGVMPPEAVAGAILRETAAMERLAQDLSVVSRVEAGAVDLHPSDFAPALLIAHAHERFAGAYEERGVVLIQGNAGELPHVTADFERASQILSNLLGNALRHTLRGGLVTLGTERRGGDVVFTVADTGGGIPPEHQGRIFERFYRVDPARTRGDGSGVGLTIARGLATRMGGNLTVSSGPSGSTFTLTLLAAHGSGHNQLTTSSS
ncbi:sensor histidine kinase [Deinococcus marmoris]|uniref:histidine kinase n=1 Tax=Deinococcus marmoris TaxID=249408 RepID=A0A1U7NU12_9DEIO|nr:HAMP domain-containing sensor histidine kinase [Deinococcus marmoris]OLV16414.1 sensor histidine kinase [Deinococcus marmoris]